MKTTDDIWFVYDGECPICQMGSSLYKMRQSVGGLHTVDARTEKQHPVMQEISAANLDLDQGMVIKYGNKLHQGNDDLSLMAALGADDGVFNKINNGLFRFRVFAVLLYPFIRFARNTALSL